jgi:hypothetical protein
MLKIVKRRISSGCVEMEMNVFIKVNKEQTIMFHAKLSKFYFKSNCDYIQFHKSVRSDNMKSLCGKLSNGTEAERMLPSLIL